jgi:hypothetical protein
VAYRNSGHLFPRPSNSGVEVEDLEAHDEGEGEGADDIRLVSAEPCACAELRLEFGGLGIRIMGYAGNQMATMQNVDISTGIELMF